MVRKLFIVSGYLIGIFSWGSVFADKPEIGMYEIPNEAKLTLTEAAYARQKHSPGYSIRSFGDDPNKNSSITALKQYTFRTLDEDAPHITEETDQGVTVFSSEHKLRNHYTRIGSYVRVERRPETESKEGKITTDRTYATASSLKQQLRAPKKSLEERGTLLDYKFRRYRGTSRPNVSQVPTQNEFIPRD